MKFHRICSINHWKWLAIWEWINSRPTIERFGLLKIARKNKRRQAKATNVIISNDSHRKRNNEYRQRVGLLFSSFVFLSPLNIHFERVCRRLRKDIEKKTDENEIHFQSDRSIKSWSIFGYILFSSCLFCVAVSISQQFWISQLWIALVAGAHVAHTLISFS